MRDPAQDAAIKLAHIIATTTVEEIATHLHSLYSWRQCQPMCAWLDELRFELE